MKSDQKSKAQSFRAMHDGRMLVLPNAWDAGSAALIQHAGATAIGTTSGGVAWSLGHGDGQRLTREEMVEVVRRIAGAVDVPVTADIEGGYGPEPGDVAATVTAVVDAGAAGVNIEDSRPEGGLFEIADQAERLRAARTAAEQAGLPELVINARTDVYLLQVGEPDGRMDQVLARAAGYASAGADSLFVPGLIDLEVLRALVAASPLPVAVMAGPGAPSVPEFESVGVRRVSVGTAMAQAAFGLAHRSTAELLTKGTYGELADAPDYFTINGLFG